LDFFSYDHIEAVSFIAVLETLFQYLENLPRSFTLLGSQNGGQSIEKTGSVTESVSATRRAAGHDVLATLTAFRLYA
jgi:hypothetical protein